MSIQQSASAGRKFFWILTLSWLGSGGLGQATWTGTTTVMDPTSNREDIFRSCREYAAKQSPEAASGVVVFFSLEPLDL